MSRLRAPLVDRVAVCRPQMEQEEERPDARAADVSARGVREDDLDERRLDTANAP